MATTIARPNRRRRPSTTPSQHQSARAAEPSGVPCSIPFSAPRLDMHRSVRASIGRRTRNGGLRPPPTRATVPQAYATIYAPARRKWRPDACSPTPGPILRRETDKSAREPNEARASTPPHAATEEPSPESDPAPADREPRRCERRSPLLSLRRIQTKLRAQLVDQSPNLCLPLRTQCHGFRASAPAPRTSGGSPARTTGRPPASGARSDGSGSPRPAAGRSLCADAASHLIPTDRQVVLTTSVGIARPAQGHLSPTRDQSAPLEQRGRGAR